jgi:hypothetical protein
MNPDPELEQAVAYFVGTFEHVFDQDWAHTKGCLQNPDSYIDPAGTFINPIEFDETNNWASRAALLERYRELAEVLLRRGIQARLPDEDDDSPG